MTAPTDDDFDDEDEDYPRTVRVPIAFDPFGNPTGFVETGAEIAGQWDQTVWRDHV